MVENDINLDAVTVSCYSYFFSASVKPAVKESGKQHTEPSLYLETMLGHFSYRGLGSIYPVDPVSDVD